MKTFSTALRGEHTLPDTEFERFCEATTDIPFSDYRRWCSPQLFQSELDHQLEQWWKKGETFSTLLREFQSSMCQLLPNLADSMCWTPMKLYVWHNSPMLLSFPNFNLEMVPAELSNFLVWLTVPRSYLDQMYHRLRNGQVWELSPTQFNFSNGELNLPLNFSQMQAPVTLDFGFRPRSEQSGTLTALFTLDQCPFALKAQHFWAELLCKGLYFSIMQGLTF